MGCCKSRQIKQDTKDSLLSNEQNSSSIEDRNNGTRGVSLQQSFSPFSNLLNNLSRQRDSDGNENDIMRYEPPVLIQKVKIFEGKTILKPPHLDELKRTAWIEKRGHLVSNFGICCGKCG